MSNPRYPSPVYGMFTKDAQNHYLSFAAAACARMRGHDAVTEATRHWTAPYVPTDHWVAKEAETRHDIAAWVTLVRGALGTAEARDQFHSGLTSSDLVDTALGYALRDASAQIMRSHRLAVGAVAQFAYQHRGESIRGRTHGQNAEYVSVGRRVAAQLVRLESVRLRQISLDKSSGPVGIGGEIGDTQVSNRRSVATLMSDLVEMALAIEQLALDVRLMARDPERIVYTGLSEGQMGSSSMPDKNNPIIAEKLCGLVGVIRANARAAQDATVLWEERDISHSSVERTAMVEALGLTDYCLDQLRVLFEGLQVNWELPIVQVSAVQAYDALVEHGGLTREQAYREIQSWGPSAALHKVGVAHHVRITGYNPESEGILWLWVERQMKRSN